MAIVFDCPHCKVNYRLKDEFAGKTATCKNPSCRKVIPIPKLVGASASSKPVDVDAIAAAAFSDELIAQQEAGPEAMIQVTCIGCDHVWPVEASKEGKNVLCPECRKSNRVPPRKKAEKADWRGGPNKPSLAKVDMGLDRAGSLTSANMGGISTQTAQEIMKERDSVEEPEVRRKKFIKRGMISLVVMLTLGAGIYYLVKRRGESRADGNMADAVKELVDGSKDPRFAALIHRASAEYQIRDSKNGADTKVAMEEFKLARNLAKSAGSKIHDQNAILSEVAVSMIELLGTTEQVEKEQRLAKDVVLKELRLTLQAMSDPDCAADTVRAVTRKCVEKEQIVVVQDVVKNFPNSNELLGQIGLELFRIDREKHRSEVEKIHAGAPTAAEPSMQALRIVLGKAKSAQKKEVSKEAAASTSWIAAAESSALKGEFANIKTSVAYANVADRVKALAAAGHAGFEKNPAEVTPLLEEAAKLLTGEAKGNPAVSPWVGIRVCRLLGKIGKFELGEAVAKSLADEQTQGWAQLEVLRGRLGQDKKKKGEEAWLDAVGNPSNIVAAAKAREEIARHNTAAGENYSATVKSMEKGKVKPFGTAGIVLGNQDRK